MKLCDTERSAIREIVETWNPLSGAPGHQPAPGEYDRLINRICDSIERKMRAGDLAHNIHEEVGQMGVTLDEGAADNIVRKIDKVLLDKRKS